MCIRRQGAISLTLRLQFLQLGIDEFEMRLGEVDIRQAFLARGGGSIAGLVADRRLLVALPMTEAW